MTLQTPPLLKSRKIARRIIVEGNLTLLTPAHLGNGETNDETDMPLLVDPKDGKTPLLTGTSIAGALRSYLFSLEMGNFFAFPVAENKKERDVQLAIERKSGAAQLFGGSRMDDAGEQSMLIVEDAYGTSGNLELRAGVSISPQTRTAEDDKLYNAQYWQAGAIFRLRFELLLPASEEKQTQLKQLLATALSGFENEEIAIGARKRRGFGRCKASGWKVIEYDLLTPTGLLNWLSDSRQGEKCSNQITDLLGNASAHDQRTTFHVTAQFALDGSILIRSSSGDPTGPDVVHLHSQRNGQLRPIVSGSSLAGALRARARKIVNTLQLNQSLVTNIFGGLQPGKKQLSASRLIVHESEITGTLPWDDELVQSRVKIDRFTGGAFPAALFAEQPIFAQQNTRLQIEFTLQCPQNRQTSFEAQIGLLLLLLKDLMTGDLPIGGESSVGRGRLHGSSATLTYKTPQETVTWQMEQKDNHAITFLQGKPADLETFVTALTTMRTKEKA